MVQGLNWNNYSPNQIIEMKNNGIEVPDEVYEKAEAALSEQDAQEVTSQGDDAAEVSYTIADDAAEVNEAEQEVAAAEEYGANLKDILGTLIGKCFIKDAEMAKLTEQLDEYTLQMEDVMSQTSELTEETEAELETVKAEAEDAAAKIEEKQAEVEEKTDEIENLQVEAEAKSVEGDVDAADAADAKIEDLEQDIEDLNAEISTLGDDVDVKAQAEEMVKLAANVKLQLLGKTMDDVKNDLEGALNDATNANEYADVTIEKGIEATEISSRREARKAGFKDGFFGFFGSKKDAHRMGEFAIARGEHLGNSTVGVGNKVKQLGSQYSMSFAETTNLMNLTSKEYVDTSKMDEMQNPNEVGFFKRHKVIKQNRQTISDIANEAKAKKASEAEPKAE